MPDTTRRNLIVPFAASSVVTRARFAQPESGREIMRKRYFPNVPLVSHEGKRVSFYDDLLKDKIVVLNFMYADCTSLCPMLTLNLLAAKRILEKRVTRDIFFYSLTIKPKQDTPAKLRSYAAMHGVAKNWLFLTGKPADLELLRLKLGYGDPNPAKDRKDKSLHSGVVRYGNEPLSQWSSVQGSADPEWIAEQICYVIPEAVSSGRT